MHCKTRSAIRPRGRIRKQESTAVCIPSPGPPRDSLVRRGEQPTITCYNLQSGGFHRGPRNTSGHTEYCHAAQPGEKNIFFSKNSRKTKKKEKKFKKAKIQRKKKNSRRNLTNTFLQIQAAVLAKNPDSH